MSGYARLSLNFDENNQLIPKEPPPSDAPAKVETKRDDSLRFKPASLSGGLKNNRPKPKPKPFPKPMPPVTANAVNSQESDGKYAGDHHPFKTNDPPAGNKRPATIDDWMPRPEDAETIKRYNEIHRPSKKVKRERERERQLERQKPKQVRQIDKYDYSMNCKKYTMFRSTGLKEGVRKQWPSHTRRANAVWMMFDQKAPISSDTTAAMDTGENAVMPKNVASNETDSAAKTRANIAAAIAKIKLQQLEKSAAAQATQSTVQAVPPASPTQAGQGVALSGQQFVPPPPPPPPPRDFIPPPPPPPHMPTVQAHAIPPPPPPAPYSHTISSGPVLYEHSQQLGTQTGFVPPPPPPAPVPRVPYSPTISAGPVLIQRPAHDAVGSIPPPPPAPSASRASYSATISAGPVLIQRSEQSPGQAGTMPPPPPSASGDQEMLDDEDAVLEPAEQPRPSKKGLGARLLKKQGWKPGQGLGAQGQGITRAIIVKPDKRHRDSIGGGYVGAARGTIIGGKKAKIAGDDDATMESSVVKITNMLAGMDVDTEIENDLFSRIGENLTKYGTNERLFIWRESSGGNDEVFVKYNSPVSALRACQGLDGTFFAGNEIKAQLWDEDKFEKGVYA